MTTVRMVVHADFPDWNNYTPPVRSLINFFIKESACFFKGKLSDNHIQSISGNIRTKLHSIMEIDNDLSVFSIPESVELDIPYTDQSLSHIAEDFLPDCTSTLVSKQSTLKLCKIDSSNVETYTGGIDPIDSIPVNLYSTIDDEENDNPLYRPCHLASSPSNIVEVPIRSDISDFYSDYQLRTSSFYIEDSTFTISADVYYKIGICPLDKKYPYKNFSSTPVTPGMTLDEIKSLLLQNEEVLVNGASTYVNGLYYKLLKCTIATERDSFNSGNYGIVSSLIIPIVNSSNQIVGLGYIKLFNQDGTEFTGNIRDKNITVLCRPNENGTPEEIRFGDSYGLHLSITDQKLDGGYIQSVYTKDTETESIYKPLMFLSKQDGSTIEPVFTGTVGLQSSSDGEIWTGFSSKKTLNNGDRLYVKVSSRRNSNQLVRFRLTGKLEAYNNINSLLSPNFKSIKDLTGFGAAFYQCFNNSASTNSGANSLLKAPLLPATILTEQCYYYMFRFCMSLQYPPELPATTLATSCYDHMFSECSSLKEAPELPATSLAISCYSGMFSNCTSLVKAPKLPATTLANYCYSYMFSGCSSLIEAPELSASNLANYCYQYMFNGCVSLSKAPELPATTLADYCYQYMFYGCSDLVEPPELPAITLSNYCYTGMFLNCVRIVDAPVMKAQTCASSSCRRMFYGCLSLRHVTLPATTLNDYSYYEMFSGCVSLVDSPTEISAITVGQYSCGYMFQNCTNLIKAPEIKATNLANYCFTDMFRGCSYLVYPPELPLTTLARYCYQNMFYGCTRLLDPPELPATTLADGCYYQMFYDCRYLRKAPDLHAQTLVSYCYGGMFYLCVSLTRIFIYATNNSASGCLSNWVGGISSSGEFYCMEGVTYSSGSSGKPSSWTRYNMIV